MSASTAHNTASKSPRHRLANRLGVMWCFGCTLGYTILMLLPGRFAVADAQGTFAILIAFPLLLAGLSWWILTLCAVAHLAGGIGLIMDRHTWLAVAAQILSAVKFALIAIFLTIAASIVTFVGQGLRPIEEIPILRAIFLPITIWFHGDVAVALWIYAAVAACAVAVWGTVAYFILRHAMTNVSPSHR